jgi:hypothetical protein
MGHHAARMSAIYDGRLVGKERLAEQWVREAVAALEEVFPQSNLAVIAGMRPRVSRQMDLFD